MAFKTAFTAALKGLTSVDPNGVQFLLFSDDDIRKLSVAKITNTQTFDSMGNATKGGLYDPALGPIRDRNELCGTCSNPLLHCQGHFGHIELPLVVVNPLFIKNIYTLFRISCLKCCKMQLNDKMKTLLTLQLQLVDVGQVTAALDLENLYNNDAIWGDKKDNVPKIIRKYQKLLKQNDPVAETFSNKNSDRLRSKIVNNVFKSVSTSKLCLHCKGRIIKVTTSENRIMHTFISDNKETKGIKILMPDEIKRYCTSIAQNNEDILKECFPILKHSKTDPATNIFFMEIIPVIPPSLRPCNVLRGEVVEHPQNNIYKAIMTMSYNARAVLQVLASPTQKTVDNLDQEPRQAYESVHGASAAEKLHTVWQDLQKYVNFILNCEGQSLTSLGLKQVIEKKTGVIRMHMMGKRVNFAARSVITPDPNVDIDEIGIPDAFATKLTYPVPVTEWNVEELRKMVINGPNKHPGAEKLEIENGRVILIPADSIQKRKSIAKRLLTPDEYKKSSLKIVHRHLVNGDVLILNRQPSLHKPSMMAHRARILKGEKTLRLHYANCKSYNADFDGDEMNAHFPQKEIARSEAYHIMSVRKQYLVPKDGTPLSGLIQDHVISGVKMSLRGTFFTKTDYQQLVFQALSNHRGEIKLLPPTILKPMVLWSGKQVLSTIIINSIPKGKPYLSLTSNAKISSKAWQKTPPRPWKAGGSKLEGDNMTEAEVIIQKGELLSGVLDKTHYGATPYGLVHCMYELYGGDSSSALLSSFSKVFSFYLQWIGFTLGVKDILVVEEANKKRDDYISLVRNTGKIAAAKATDLPVDVDDNTLKETIEEMMQKDPKFRANLDRQYKNLLDTHTNSINTACLTEGLLEKFPYNNLQLMVQSGAKGSTVNTMQISCLLGQIELEGKRPPLMISGRSLPSFPPYDVSPRAGGFIDGRFMTGIQPQEFFFHCMAGREGLIDTAVKTSRSGYLQRCLIKHLEGLSVGYDHTVRDGDGSVIQFAYGEDGLDVLKCQFLKGKQFGFLDVNAGAVVSKSVINTLKEDSDNKSIAKAQKSLKKWKKKHGDPFAKVRTSPFTEFSKVARNNIDLDEKPTDETRDPYYWELEKMWRSLDEEERQQYARKKCPDPIPSKISPEFKFGAINEQLDGIIHSYLKNRKENAFTKLTDKEKFTEVINAKYLESMADPGEPVGLLAAQSIGEPSTQMTLNTFHFAGRGDMNVTLGIPRLREILMTASLKLKTPNMDIPFKDLPDLNKKAERLRQKLNRVTVADVLEKIDVDCEIVTEPNRQLKTTLKFWFLPKAQYKTQYAVKPKQIINHMARKFFAEMFVAVRKQARTSSGVVWSAEKKKRPRRRDEDDEEDVGEEAPAEKEPAADPDDSSDDEPTNDDDDATQVKKRNKRAEEQEYEDPESEDEEKSDDEDMNDDQAGDNDNADKDNGEAADVSAADKTTMHEVVSKIDSATNYSFDTKNHQWCELTVLFPIAFLKVDLSQALRDAAAKSVIREVKNIKRAITNRENNVLFLKTDGINIVEMFKYDDLLHVDKLYSNDVHAIARTYGIEAANKVIIKEIKNVFNVYGITVDPRHLSLIADYMTYNGVFEPMSRKGMEASTSPLQQMSFESSIVFLKEAVLNAKVDKITSASSCLMLGQPCRCGTGAFDVRPLIKPINNKKKFDEDE
ncbi:DNA-directed RNA polymerase I subunit RPA1 [Leguminivora glycinivorella]|uniref:DNA-directed RNA polymerase I subunit RPA1 n=1 Tax=Leguminivora glycinivorella TaxID=1035111 RepID=UPI00200FCD87|nr:DNA-directed RNA polymerase I subunit RPA1 [Leguminivora glycinivorella]